MRYALVLLLALALALSSLAQNSYMIRLDIEANLRVSPGLDSDIAAVVPQGAELEVLEHFNRWLKVVHDDAERWLADWVQHTQLTEMPSSMPVPLAPYRPAHPSSTMIRLDIAANLRESHSLDSALVARLAEGSLLSVSDEFNRWLQVPYRGSELWLADWVMHTRLSLEEITSIYAPPPPPPPVIIDNCCLVGRDCRTEAEWVRGYFDFHSSWCPAPAAMADMSMS